MMFKTYNAINLNVRSNCTLHYYFTRHKLQIRLFTLLINHLIDVVRKHISPRAIQLLRTCISQIARTGSVHTSIDNHLCTYIICKKESEVSMVGYYSQ